jgi:hypothetical protein
MSLSPTSLLTRRYLTRPVEAYAPWTPCRPREAAVEPCQLALHLPLIIRYNASLCTALTSVLTSMHQAGGKKRTAVEDGEDGGPSMSRLYRVGGWLPTPPLLSRSLVHIRTQLPAQISRSSNTGGGRF